MSISVDSALCAPEKNSSLIQLQIRKRVVQSGHLKYSTIWKVDIFNAHIIPLQFISTFLLNVLSIFYVRSINCKWLFDEFNLLLLLPALCKEFTWQGNGYLAQQDAHELYLAIASAIQTSTAHK